MTFFGRHGKESDGEMKEGTAAALGRPVALKSVLLILNVREGYTTMTADKILKQTSSGLKIKTKVNRTEHQDFQGLT